MAIRLAGKVCVITEFGRQMCDRTLLRRFGQAEDIASAALYLASDENSYVTAIDLVVDGGMKVW